MNISEYPIISFCVGSSYTACFGTLCAKVLGMLSGEIHLTRTCMRSHATSPSLIVRNITSIPWLCLNHSGVGTFLSAYSVFTESL